MPRMSRFAARPSKPAIFFVLMVFSAVNLLLPTRWSDSLKHLTQLLVPVQELFYRPAVLTRRAAAQFLESNDGPGGSGGPNRRALENVIVFQQGLLEQVRRENAELRGLRGRTVARDARLIPARVVARDPAAQRGALVIGRGASGGVTPGDGVVSRVFIDHGADEGIEVGFAVLARESLLGRVEQVSPYVSRVRLLTDPDSRLRVQVGRIMGERFSAVPYPCTMRGVGGGRMRIADVPEKYLAPGDAGTAARDDQIRPGDLVATAADEPGLPAPLAVGRVVDIVREPPKRLVASIEVVPLVDANAQSDVFVVASRVAAP